MKEHFLETDLHRPVSEYFKKMGFEIRSEIHHCDISAMKDGELVLIELKKNLSIELLSQAVKRQKLADRVYMAIPKPKKLYFNAKWRDLFHLIRRLELGLIIVTFKGDQPTVEEVIEPIKFNRDSSVKRGKKRREKLVKEFNGRHKDLNTGGSTRKKIITAYLESSIHIACCLEKFGKLSPKKLREYGTDPDKTLVILNRNVYGWFERVKIGLYKISKAGKKALKEQHELADYYRKIILKIKLLPEEL